MARSSRYREPKKGPCTIDTLTEQRLEQAREDWLMTTKFRSVKNAAKAYNVPYWTLVRRINGTALPKKQAHDSQALLTQTEKETLIEWIQYLGICGLPLNK
ncbi:hypothetical protein F5050DRAFT_171009 [Lentinula boryana]|uniref:HTH psq-type domain-containing protein n=1 Tax=Lentinula boryana TaxID=40481 RepID=A0ABQ8PWC5_9AGAR|nr:hypothetical protein F5050DRAFT_171009 [Lentinula boryana]